MSRGKFKAGLKEIYIPTNSFGYYVTVFNIDLEHLSNITGIPLDKLNFYVSLGLSNASPNESILIANALGINVNDISNKHTDSVKKKTRNKRKDIEEFLKNKDENSNFQQLI